MPFRSYHCPNCGKDFKTKVEKPVHCGDEAAQLLITPPASKFMEKVDPEKGTSALVGQTAILKARARAHSRDIEMDDLIQNNERELAQQNGWINSEGKRRKVIDDK